MAEHNGNGGVRINWQSALVVLVGWLVSAVLAYGAVDARVRVLEASYDRLLYDMREIKTDVKQILERGRP
jgi:hypothetical protein